MIDYDIIEWLSRSLIVVEAGLIDKRIADFMVFY